MNIVTEILVRSKYIEYLFYLHVISYCTHEVLISE